MPATKAGKARKKGHHRHRANRAQDQRVAQEETTKRTSTTLVRNENPQGVFSLVMSAMVALGCWGFAYTFTFSQDSNRYLFVGMAALIALMWSVSFFVRLRRWQRRR